VQLENYNHDPKYKQLGASLKVAAISFTIVSFQSFHFSGINSNFANTYENQKETRSLGLAKRKAIMVNTVI
jgi:hypothetical protein